MANGRNVIPERGSVLPSADGTKPKNRHAAAPGQKGGKGSREASVCRGAPGKRPQGSGSALAEARSGKVVPPGFKATPTAGMVGRSRSNHTDRDTAQVRPCLKQSGASFLGVLPSAC